VKQNSLFNITKNKRHVIEIGVNAGHSLLIMLLASKYAIFDVFDICEYSYTIPCIAYLNSNFDNRVHLHYGDSKYSFPHFVKTTRKTYDLFHIDGMHSLEYVYNEINCSLTFANQDNCHIVVDDYCSDVIKKACDKHEKANNIKLFATISCYAEHAIFIPIKADNTME